MDFSDNVPTHLLSCCHSMAGEQLVEPSAMSGLGQAAVSLQSRSAMAGTVHTHSEMLSNQIYVSLKWLNDQTCRQHIVIILEKRGKKRENWTEMKPHLRQVMVQFVPFYKNYHLPQEEVSFHTQSNSLLDCMALGLSVTVICLLYSEG